MLLSLLACAPLDGTTRTPRQGPADDDGTGTQPTGTDTTDTSETTELEEPPCSATAHRARCSLPNPEDESPILEPGIAFDALVPSWNADTPAGAFIEIEVEVRVDGAWSNPYQLGLWAGGESEVDRHSFDGQSDAWGTVYTDTLVLKSPADAARLRVKRHGGATVSRLAIAVADLSAQDADAGGLAWGISLDPPDRSQMVFDEGESWCSPTSTSMILGYQAELLGDPNIDSTVPDAADQTWDSVYRGNGNWPFNTAFAATKGLNAEVLWLGSVSELEPWIAAGFPLAVSAAWGPGEVDGAPISSTSGHLLVVSGFTSSGDVEVHDPAAASDAEVPRTYDRAQFERAWMGGSSGVAYGIWTGDRPAG